jgi:hypothetical protein
MRQNTMLVRRSGVRLLACGSLTLASGQQADEAAEPPHDNPRSAQTLCGRTCGLSAVPLACTGVCICVLDTLHVGSMGSCQ